MIPSCDGARNDRAPQRLLEAPVGQRLAYGGRRPAADAELL